MRACRASCAAAGSAISQTGTSGRTAPTALASVETYTSSTPNILRRAHRLSRHSQAAVPCTGKFPP